MIKIITDSNSDRSKEYYQKNDVEVIPFSYFIESEEYIDDFETSLSVEQFYDLIKSGKLSTTSQINPFTFEETFSKYLEEGMDVIYLGFSSELSKSFSNAVLAANNLNEKYSNIVTCINSVSATAGQALLLDKLIELRENGTSYDNIIDIIDEIKIRTNIWFTVDDLDHLKRGGRISPAAANIANAIKIKPIMNLSKEGKIVPIKKVRGRKKAIKQLYSDWMKNTTDDEKQDVYITHGDCIEDAHVLADLIKGHNPKINIVINPVGPVIGSHTGQGVIVLSYIGVSR